MKQLSTNSKWCIATIAISLVVLILSIIGLGVWTKPNNPQPPNPPISQQDVYRDIKDRIQNAFIESKADTSTDKDLARINEFEALFIPVYEMLDNNDDIDKINSYMQDNIVSYFVNDPIESSTPMVRDVRVQGTIIVTKALLASWNGAMMGVAVGVITGLVVGGLGMTGAGAVLIPAVISVATALVMDYINSKIYTNNLRIRINSSMWFFFINWHHDFGTVRIGW